ncbi:MAG: hypothetical protein ACLSVD_04080 [Eggerthellaceae bacterium]
MVACIASRSHGTRKAVGVSRRQLMEATGLTADQTRRACRSLDRRGLLDVRERFRENGGCAENAYSSPSKPWRCSVQVPLARTFSRSRLDRAHSVALGRRGTLQVGACRA